MGRACAAAPRARLRGAGVAELGGILERHVLAAPHVVQRQPRGLRRRDTACVSFRRGPCTETATPRLTVRAHLLAATAVVGAAHGRVGHLLRVVVQGELVAAARLRGAAGKKPALQLPSDAPAPRRAACTHRLRLQRTRRVRRVQAGGQACAARRGARARGRASLPEGQASSRAAARAPRPAATRLRSPWRPGRPATSRRRPSRRRCWCPASRPEAPRRRPAARPL